MSRFTIFEYNRQNRNLIVEELEAKEYISCLFISIPLTDKFTINEREFLNTKNKLFIDISTIVSNEDKLLWYAGYVENAMNEILNKHLEDYVYIIVDRRYTKTVIDLFWYKIKKVISIEKFYNLSIPENRNVVDLENNDFEDLIAHIQYDLVGHSKYKIRLEEELRKFRVFNRLGYHSIFSTLIMGNSGIGKTELARILHRYLSPKEPFIKINFGNYSDQNALNSLIGSPRGYAGSNTGELTDKLLKSKSNIILIDEFEKSHQSVQNFFLQLLEDGVFTDSLGRDYDLNKFIIVFTTNVPKDKIAKDFSSELLSRFNLVYSFLPLNIQQKEEYVEKRLENILKDIKKNLNIEFNDNIKQKILNFDYKKYENMRDINSQLMKRISDELYPILYKEE